MITGLQTLKSQLLAFSSECDTASNMLTIQRVEYEINSIDFFQIFNFIKVHSKIFWSDRCDETTVLGIGVADMICDDICTSTEEAVNMIADRLSVSDDGIKYFGGSRFDSNYDSSEDYKTWTSFGSFKFVVPIIEFIRRGSTFYIAYNKTVGDYSHLKEVLNLYLLYSSSKAQSSEQVSRINTPINNDKDKSKWCFDVENIIGSLNDTLTKVVLARCQNIVTDKNINSSQIMNLLFKENYSTYDFCFEFDEHISFLGSSPECLYRRTGKEVYCEAVAGTSNDDAESLEYSKKDVLEHNVVHQQILTKLLSLCSSISTEQVKTLQLNDLQHLISSFQGYLKPNISDSLILKTIHPTAAVCGEPSGDALSKIYELEAFDRGWYSGPVGWISKESSEFAVAIRSALINKNVISIFAGAGVVKDSIPALEWDETCRKMQQFFRVVN